MHFLRLLKLVFAWCSIWYYWGSGTSFHLMGTYSLLGWVLGMNSILFFIIITVDTTWFLHISFNTCIILKRLFLKTGTSFSHMKISFVFFYYLVIFFHDFCGFFFHIYWTGKICWRRGIGFFSFFFLHFSSNWILYYLFLMLLVFFCQFEKFLNFMKSFYIPCGFSIFFL